MKQFETIQYEARAGVATVTLNRPDAFNALNRKLLSELLEAFQEMAGDPQTRAIVLTGTGRAFSSGQDLRDFSDDGVDPAAAVRDGLENGYAPVIRAIRGIPKPVIGAINGVAAGAGMSLALSTDLRVASDRASFTLAFSRIALVPDAGATFFLPQLVGLPRALELAWSSRRVLADEALAIGLVNQVVPADELMTASQELAEGLARGPALALGLTKRAMLQGLTGTLNQSLTTEVEMQQQCIVTDDFREGVQAFLEKREARFGQRGEQVPEA